MKYVVFPKFFDENYCNKLIDDANKFISGDTYIKMHGNRQSFSASNLEYTDLCKDSVSWDSLEKKINSHEFLEFCCKKLNVDINKFCLRNFFKTHSPILKKLDKMEKNYKKLGHTKSKLISSNSLIKFILFRTFRNIYRKIMFSKLVYPNKKPVELLYDYSKAGNGYTREIHRDSDNRIMVFLLYLNSLPKESEGGNLDIYKLVKKDSDLVRPSYDSCEKIDSIKPEAGKLVLSLNTETNYHAVSVIKKSNTFRHFICGYYTLLGQKNPFIKNKTKMKTEFNFYE